MAGCPRVAIAKNTRWHEVFTGGDRILKSANDCDRLQRALCDIALLYLKSSQAR
ncbi:MAG: hypothetical protein SAK29_15975 [Scytonema sp. PMC 1069.18]|nr:hypothetical protein [Scytonema sp. PMC 1069.18]MEC4882448.1 hypothetical protein [Scytonema sp. PMC 1070.18]